VQHRRAVHLGRDRGEHVLDVGVRLPVTAGHDARAFERTLLSPGDPHTQEAQALVGKRPGPPLGVAEVRVPAVDDRVALLQMGHELVDHRIDGRAGLHHGHDGARPFDGGHQLLDRPGADDRAFIAVLGHEPLGLAGRAVVHGHGDAVVGDVAGQVGTHHGQARQPEVRSVGHRRSCASCCSGEREGFLERPEHVVGPCVA
jgi:hypothetical protein